MGAGRAPVESDEHHPPLVPCRCAASAAAPGDRDGLTGVGRPCPDFVQSRRGISSSIFLTKGDASPVVSRKYLRSASSTPAILPTPAWIGQKTIRPSATWQP